MAFIRMRLTNRPKEAINGLIQLANWLPSGQRSICCLKIMGYLKVGKFQLDVTPFRTLPTN